MGFQFGDYIHYNYKNYLKYGTAKKTDGRKQGEANFSAMLSSYSSKILNLSKQNASREWCKKLEDNLNYFSGFGNLKGGTVDLDPEQIQKLQNILTEIMSESFDIAQNGIDFNSGRVSLKSALNKTMPGMYKLSSIARSHAGYTTGKQEVAFSLGNLRKRADMALAYARQFLEQKKQPRGNDLEQMVNKLQAERDKFFQEFEPEAVGLIGVNEAKWKEAATFQDSIKELAKACLFRQAISLCEGQLEEYIVAAISGVLEGEINLNESELAKSLIIKRASPANARGQNQMLRSTIYTKLDPLWESQVLKGSSYKPFSASGSDDIISYKTNASQKKVNVDLMIGGASVKSYNLKGDYTTKVGISLVSQTNLLTILLQYPVFANHYLNVAGVNSTHSSSGLLYQANAALKQLVFLTAISGALYKDAGNFADYFIVKDKSTGKHSVYLISDLLEKVMRNLDLVTIKTNTQEITRGTTWSNEWVGYSNHSDPSMQSAMIRIARLSKQLQTNISVHMNPMALF